MSEETETTETAETAASTSESKETEKGKTGAIAHYKQQLSDYRSALESERSERERLAQEIESLKNQNLESKSNYKELWEREKERAAQAVQRAEAIETSYIDDLKRSALQTEAAKLGLKENYSNFLDISKISVERTDHGNAHVLGVSSYLEDFKQQYPDMFKQQSAPIVNTGTPTNYTPQSTQITTKEIVRLQKEDKDGYYDAMEKIRSNKLKLVQG